MAKHLNDWYTEGLLNNDPKVIRSIFNEFLPSVEAYVRSHGGNEEDAKDVFMEALIVIYKKIKAKELILTVQFPTYLIAICKNLWLKIVRRKKFDAGVTPDDPVVSKAYGEVQKNEFSEKNEQQQLFDEKFHQLPNDCQTVLSITWHTELSMEDVAEAMGWTYAYARKRKHLCKENLIKAIKSDPRYRELRA